MMRALDLAGAYSALGQTVYQPKIKSLAKPLGSIWKTILAESVKGYTVAYIWVGDRESNSGKAAQAANDAGFAVSTQSMQRGLEKGELVKIEWNKKSRGELPRLACQFVALATNTSLKSIGSFGTKIHAAARAGYMETTLRAGDTDSTTGKQIYKLRSEGFTVTTISTQRGVELHTIHRVVWKAISRPMRQPAARSSEENDEYDDSDISTGQGDDECDLSNGDEDEGATDEEDVNM